ncbi:DUF2125 domain-containing protein [Bartonella tribocorum]|uniref:DUF2125 domain-containing protein n=1 Tax=Bartonella tribocorum (strain DSM 28219 / CCUG 45778 / CIP 105476 / IBS 506) TaxID=382640 RepID=A9IZE9_BART1|nr:hypothetical protein BT_2581 [Bartonella tribocorum CIP 105476]CDO49870.1 hypothetical protein BM1374166_02227 [Bartonella tribocorum]
MAAVCENVRKNGYPLRIGVVCDKFQFSWPLYGVSLSTGRLTAGAPIYAPHVVEFNIDSPASIMFSDKTSIVSRWRNLVIETEPYWKTGQTLKFIAEGLEFSPLSSSFEDQKLQEAVGSQTADKKTTQQSVEDQTSLQDTPDVAVQKLEPKDVSQKITAEFLRLDLKREKNHFSGNMTFDGFDVSPIFISSFVEVPKIDGNLKWILNDVSLLSENEGKNWRQHLYGKSGILKHGELAFHTGGGMHVSGPFSFDDEGYLTAKFELVCIQHMKFLETLQHLFPEEADNFQALFFILSTLPKNADGAPVLSLTVSHGWVKLGFLELGRLDPL